MKKELSVLYKRAKHFRWFIDSLNYSQKLWFISLLISEIRKNQTEEEIQLREDALIKQIIDYVDSLVQNEEWQGVRIPNIKIEEGHYG